LALLASIWLLFHAYELIWWREARAHVRARRAQPAAVAHKEDVLSAS
jgi:hypothetical protein